MAKTRAQKDRFNAYYRARYAALRAEALEVYGGHCACCGEPRKEFLAIDHIDGGGSQHRKKDSCAVRMPEWLKKNGWPEGYRILCHNCNLSIGFYGYCPHGNLR